jgi:hypothetical protein
MISENACSLFGRGRDWRCVKVDQYQFLSLMGNLVPQRIRNGVLPGQCYSLKMNSIKLAVLASLYSSFPAASSRCLEIS